jgi:hypothetical protein
LLRKQTLTELDTKGPDSMKWLMAPILSYQNNVVEALAEMRLNSLAARNNETLICWNAQDSRNNVVRHSPFKVTIQHSHAPKRIQYMMRMMMVMKLIIAIELELLQIALP